MAGVNQISSLPKYVLKRTVTNHVSIAENKIVKYLPTLNTSPKLISIKFVALGQY
jgi:hypothetical protein